MTRPRNPWTKLRFWRAWHDERGSAGVEFALIAPVFILILAGIFEIGLVIRAKFAVNAVISAAANQTLMIGDMINEGSAETIAATLAALVAGDGRSVTVNINNAVTAHLDAGQLTVMENGAAVSGCYCATRTDGQLAWGAVLQCGAACRQGSVAGRFVVITAEAPFDPSLGLYGFFTDEVIRDSAVVRLP